MYFSNIHRLLTPAALLVATLIPAGTLAAQPQLRLTVSEAGNFTIFNGLGVGGGCTQWSPQFSNFTGGVPGGCQSLITLLIQNTGTTATPPGSTVTLNDTIISYMPKAISVLGAPYSGPTTLSGQPPINWNCSVNPAANQFSCTTTDQLQVGKTAVVLVRVLVEDFAQYGMNNLATLSLNGVKQDQSFDSQVQWPGITSPQSQVTVHSMPEGRNVIVDGVVVTAPHTFTWTRGDMHTIVGDSGAANIVFSGLSSPSQPSECAPGTPLPTSSCIWTMPPANPIILAAPLDYIVSSTLYDYLTVVY